MPRWLTHERREHPILFWTLVIIGLAVTWPFLLTYWLLRWIWKSIYPQNVKLGVTGAVALLWLVLFAVVGASNQNGSPATAQAPTPTAETAPLTPSTAATPTPTPAPTPTPRPNATAIPHPATAPAVQPTRAPTSPPQPAFSYCGAPANPWHYNFCGGSVINPPPSNFCSYFNCIASFWTEDHPNDGYVIQCVDGRFSDSGGEAGSPCSSHGGPSRTLYSP
jgi:hypothetical protein